MIEVRFHGRGGQGAVTAARVLSNAFVRQGKFGSSFPMFGFERRGAPVTAFMRFDERPIREKTQVYNPDCLVVLDASQKNSPIVYEGLKPNGILVLNSTKPVQESIHDHISLVGELDAETIALEELGISSPSTCLVGAFAATTQWTTLEYVLSSLEQFFEGDILEGNIRCARRGFKEVNLTKW